jgi:hypothetical protein
MKTNIRTALLDPKFAASFVLEIEEVTDREYLDLLVIANQIAIRDNHRLSNKHVWAVHELKQVKERLKALNKYIIKTPPVTPQLNLF